MFGEPERECRRHDAKHARPLRPHARKKAHPRTVSDVPKYTADTDNGDSRDRRARALLTPAASANPRQQGFSDAAASPPRAETHCHNKKTCAHLRTPVSTSRPCAQCSRPRVRTGATAARLRARRQRGRVRRGETRLFYTPAGGGEGTRNRRYARRAAGREREWDILSGGEHMALELRRRLVEEACRLREAKTRQGDAVS